MADSGTLIVVIASILGAIGVGWIGFMVRRIDRKMAQIDDLLVAFAAQQQSVKGHSGDIESLKDSQRRMEEALARVREDVAVLKAARKADSHF